jgi:polysaccharide deacetylase family protein (PEP-CTERM system associated)
MKQHLLTIGLDDYFHAGALKRFIKPQQWYRFEMRIEQNTFNTLDLLERFGVSATFFVMGWIADKRPDLVKEVARRGHEIANLGYYHRSIHEMTRTEFEEDLIRAEHALYQATGKRPYGYRLARPLFKPEDLWVLDILAKHGYSYDCSLMPMFGAFRDEPWRRFAHRHRFDGKELWEFPFSTWDCLGYLFPISGGNYFRQFPHGLMKKKVADWDQHCDSPYVLYFHVWDIDPDQPKISSAPPLTRIRAYRNLGQMRGILEDYLATYKFGSVAQYLDLREQRVLTNEQISRLVFSRGELTAPPVQVIGTGRAAPQGQKTTVTIVVPCFNEEPSLPYLANTLASVTEHLSQSYDVNFVFVDDGSRDGTWQVLQRLFGSRPDCKLIKQERNVGVAAAILSGICHARTEIVCSMDCDCTYDPHQLATLIPMLTDGVDLVTASPYHPRGRVLNVPAWRLSLSKAASWLYRRVLHHKLATYTSCFRVYRRSAVLELNLREKGFLGVAEMIGALDLRGSRIVECPTVLEVRMLGQSKMKTLRTIFGHFRILSRLLVSRVFRTPQVIAPPSKSMVTSSSRES